MTELPGDPSKAMAGLWDSLRDDEREALLPHLLGGTSADKLAGELKRAGLAIGPTSIKNYRRALRLNGDTA